MDEIQFVWNTVTAMWEGRYARLVAWKRAHGHCVVPIVQGELGTWVSKQRQLKKRGKLGADKVAALDRLGFTWSTADADWEDKFKRLVAWKAAHGHACVPFTEGELGWWVNTQRQCRKKGKLSEVRERRLDAVGFVWNPSKNKGAGGAGRAEQEATTADSAVQQQLQQVTPQVNEEEEEEDVDWVGSSLVSWDAEAVWKAAVGAGVGVEVSDWRQDEDGWMA